MKQTYMQIMTLKQWHSNDRKTKINTRTWVKNKKNWRHTKWLDNICSPHLQIWTHCHAKTNYQNQLNQCYRRSSFLSFLSFFLSKQSLETHYRMISAARAQASGRYWSTGQTDGRTDTLPLHRPCSQCFCCDFSSWYKFRKIVKILKLKCTKFDLSAPLVPLAGFNGAYF